jgi:hypothetical protein
MMRGEGTVSMATTFAAIIAEIINELDMIMPHGIIEGCYFLSLTYQRPRGGLNSHILTPF